MLRLHLLAATQQPQLHQHDVHNLFQLLRAMPAAVRAALPSVQQQQQQLLLPSSTNWLSCSSQQQQCLYASASSSTHAAEAATSSSEAAVHYPTRHEKKIANLKYCQERAAWRRQVKELRKQWLAEIQQQKQAERQHAEAVKQEIARLQELRSADKQHDREKHQLEHMLYQAEQAVVCAERRLQAAWREEWRQQTMQKYKQLWREGLEQESRAWIAPEDLEGRISDALDNPQHL